MENKRFYNKIAESWYNIRHWSLFPEELEKISERWKGGNLLNIGCAHGADFLPFDDERFEFYGTDISEELVHLARKFAKKNSKNFDLFVSDMQDLPIQSESFDYAISIAALHHLTEKDERINALEEINRILKEGGEALITVWNKLQLSFIFEKKKIKKEWNYKGKTLHRNYYLYNYFELKRDIQEAGLEIVKLYPEKDHNIFTKHFSKNIFALIQKA